METGFFGAAARWLLWGTCCAIAPATPAAPPSRSLDDVVSAARADAARRSGRDGAAFVLLSAEAVVWADGSLGCPQPGMAYTMALVPGFRVRLGAGDQAWDYHADRRGTLVLCPPGRSVAPTGDHRS